MTETGMKRIVVFFAALCMSLVSLGNAVAEEGFDSGFGGGFDSGFGADTEDGFGSDSDSDESGFGSFDSFGDSFGSEEGSASALSIGGELSLPVRAYVADPDDDREVETVPEGSLDLKYEAGKTEGTLDFSVTTDEVELNEVSVRYYGSPLLVEAGYMKKVWGKGDEYHVLNLMNPRNLEDFTNGTEYIEWIDPEVMLSLSLPVRQMGQVEMLYSPRFTGDSIPSSGRWSPYQAETIAAMAEEAVIFQASQISSTIAQTAYLSEHSSADALYPDTNGWDWSQFGVYYTDTFGSVDLGFMYYNGFYGEPAVQAGFTGTTLTSLSLDYDRMQAFGIDFAAVLGPLNTRGELAYYMTDDYDGDDPEVYNNRIKWIAGFDVGLPVSSLNINIQETGTYILGNDEIGAADMEYDDDGDYTENLILLKISDKYNHEKIEAAVTGIWHIEKQGWKIAPSVTVDLSDDLELEAEYCVYGGDDETSLLGQFDDNDYAEVKLTYSF